MDLQAKLASAVAQAYNEADRGDALTPELRPPASYALGQAVALLDLLAPWVETWRDRDVDVYVVGQGEIAVDLDPKDLPRLDLLVKPTGKIWFQDLVGRTVGEFDAFEGLPSEVLAYLERIAKRVPAPAAPRP